MEENCDVFISHASTDHKIAEYFKEKLNWVGIKAFLAEEDINVGETWEEKIIENLKASKVVLFIITPDSYNRNWIQIEAMTAKALNKIIIPGYMYVKADRVPVLMGIEGSDIRGRDDQDQLIEKIREKFNFSAFWKLLIDDNDPKEYTYAILSAKPPVDMVSGVPTIKPGRTVLVSYNEMTAMLQLQQELDLLRNKVKIIHGGVKLSDQSIQEITDPNFTKKENLIVVGSTHANNICKEIMERTEFKGLPLRFSSAEEGEKIQKCIELVGVRNYASRIKTGNKLIVDYGIISRLPNPFENKNRVLILGGNHGFGTEAAIQFVANRDMIYFLRKKIKDDDFQALYKIDLHKNQQIPPHEGLFKLTINETDKLFLQFIKIFISKDGSWQEAYSSEEITFND